MFKRRDYLIVLWPVLIVTPTAAANYPTKPIRLIVPVVAGGNPDITARLIASELGKQMGQHVGVDNRGGASGNIRFEMISKAGPGGFTFWTAAFSFVIYPSLFSAFPFYS